MPIKLRLDKKEEKKAASQGAIWIPEEKTWIIPDTITNINPFRKWLPGEEGFIVQWPYFLARAKRPCFKCGKETPVIRLGARAAQELVYETGDESVWRRWDDYALLFSEIDNIDLHIIESLQTYYPFFRHVYSKLYEGKLWGNTCVHCSVLQEDDGEFIYEAGPLSPLTMEGALEIRIVYFKLKFDYYISAGVEFNPVFDDLIFGANK